MKTLIKNYSINTSGSTITFTDYTTLQLERVLIIAEVTNGKDHSILYNFATGTSAASVSGNSFSAPFIAGLSPTASLLIYYDTDATTMSVPAGNIGGFTGRSASGLLGNTTGLLTFASGNCIGTISGTTSLQTLSGAMRFTNGSGILQSLFVAEVGSTNKCPLQVILFDSLPSSGSTFVCGSAPILAAADVSKITRIIDVNSTDYRIIGTNAIADITPGGKCLVANGSDTLYMLILAQGAATFIANSPNGLKVTLGILKD